MAQPSPTVARLLGRAGRVALSLAPVAVASTVSAPLAAQERVDMAAIAKIKDEGFKRSQVMDVMSWLTDVHGPRLTGSPIVKAAGDWKPMPTPPTPGAGGGRGGAGGCRGGAAPMTGCQM